MEKKVMYKITRRLYEKLFNSLEACNSIFEEIKELKPEPLNSSLWVVEKHTWDGRCEFVILESLSGEYYISGSF